MRAVVRANLSAYLSPRIYMYWLRLTAWESESMLLKTCHTSLPAIPKPPVTLTDLAG